MVGLYMRRRERQERIVGGRDWKNYEYLAGVGAGFGLPTFGRIIVCVLDLNALLL